MTFSTVLCFTLEKLVDLHCRAVVSNDANEWIARHFLDENFLSSFERKIEIVCFLRPEIARHLGFKHCKSTCRANS